MYVVWGGVIQSLCPILPACCHLFSLPPVETTVWSGRTGCKARIIGPLHLPRTWRAWGLSVGGWGIDQHWVSLLIATVGIAVLGSHDRKTFIVNEVVQWERSCYYPILGCAAHTTGWLIGWGEMLDCAHISRTSATLGVWILRPEPCVLAYNAAWVCYLQILGDTELLTNLKTQNVNKGGCMAYKLIDMNIYCNFCPFSTHKYVLATVALWKIPFNQIKLLCNILCIVLNCVLSDHKLSSYLKCTLLSWTIMLDYGCN